LLNASQKAKVFHTIKTPFLQLRQNKGEKIEKKKSKIQMRTLGQKIWCNWACGEKTGTD